jgi:hypothetical protein
MEGFITKDEVEETVLQKPHQQADPRHFLQADDHHHHQQTNPLLQLEDQDRPGQYAAHASQRNKKDNVKTIDATSSATTTGLGKFRFCT